MNDRRKTLGDVIRAIPERGGERQIRESDPCPDRTLRGNRVSNIKGAHRDSRRSERYARDPHAMPMSRARERI
jgi:hypothetical protein